MIMRQVLHIRCKNNKKTQEVPIGSTLSDIYKEIKSSNALWTSECESKQ